MRVCAQSYCNLLCLVCLVDVPRKPALFFPLKGNRGEVDLGEFEVRRLRGVEVGETTAGMECM